MEKKQRSFLDLRRLLADRGVSFGENRGWVQLDCPMCGDSGQHLGYNRESGAFNCFKCGRHRTWEVVSKLFGLPLAEAGALCRQYGERSVGLPKIRPEKALAVASLKLPYGTGPLEARHWQYLAKRNFPRSIASLWSLLGTGIHGAFSNRIIVPIFDELGRMVCYQGRDITDKSKSKYKACPDDEAVIPIKDCVYGLDKIVGVERVVITEGVTKVWRLGPGAVCTFGAQVSDAQVRKLAVYKKRFILFDRDMAGAVGRDALAGKLRVFPGETHIIIPLGTPDVGELSEVEAHDLMNATLK